MSAFHLAPPDRSGWNAGLQDGLLLVYRVHAAYRLFAELDRVLAQAAEAPR